MSLLYGAGKIQPHGFQKIISVLQPSDIEPHAVGLWFFFDLIVTVLVIPYWNKETLQLTLILQKPSVLRHIIYLRNFKILAIILIFKETEVFFHFIEHRFLFSNII